MKATGNAGTNNYTYSDIVNSQPQSVNSLYYRLKMVDKDGKFTYSNTITLTRNQKPETVSVYPNPAKDKLYIKGKNISHVKVVDQAGRVVMSKTVAAVDDVMIDVSKLSGGTYQLQIVTADGVTNKKVVME